MSENKTRQHGAKTHAQEQDIIAKRVNTKNADEDFDIRSDLNRSEEAREAYRKGADLPVKPDWENADDRAMVRGENQESEHRKQRIDD